MKLENYIDQQAFETDTIRIDVKQIGNISNEIKNDNMMNLINHFIQTNECMSYSIHVLLNSVFIHFGCFLLFSESIII